MTANAVRMAQRPNRPRERAAARAFLAACLRHSPVAVADIYSRARAAGIPKLYLREAKQQLKIEMLKSGFGRNGSWAWRLPEP